MTQFTIRKYALGSAATIALATMFAQSAFALDPLYAGGATFPEKTYRDIMDCYGATSSGDLKAGLVAPPATCNGATPYNNSVELLYAGVGSGNGLKGLYNHDAGSTGYTAGGTLPDSVPVPSGADFGPNYGPDTGAAWAATKSTANPFPKVSFTGSDDPLTAATVASFNANAAAGHWGAPIQVPALIGAVAMPYHAAAGTWTENGVAVTGNQSKVDLSTNTWCGIYTGAITTWDDPAITADNNGTVLGTGTITVFYRSNGSGTTFLMANALINQCATSTHPVPASWQSAGTDAQHNDPGLSNNNFFLNIAANHDAGGSPATAHGGAAHNLLPASFIGVSGSGGIKAGVLGQAGSVGYVSPDFTNINKLKPDSTGPKAMNLQTYASFKAGTTPVFKAPTYQNAVKVMTYTTAEPTAYLKAPSFAKNCATLAQGCANNPLAWGKVNPTPNNIAAYPVAGFTFMDFYTCYASATDVKNLVGVVVNPGDKLGYVRWYYGTSTENANLPKKAMNANGFSPVPGSYISSIRKLLTTNAATAIGTPGQANTGCSALVGGGA